MSERGQRGVEGRATASGAPVRVARLHGALVGGALFGAALFAGRAARADLVLEGLPTAGVGVTDNAASAPPQNAQNPPRADEFTTLGGTVRAHVRDAHADHSLGYRLTETLYFHGRGPSALSQDLAWLSDLALSPSTQLRLGASAAYGHTTSPVGVDVNAGAPTPQLANSNTFVSGGATEDLLSELSARTRLVENLHVTGVHYLTGTATSSFVFGGILRGERDVGQNVLSLEGDVTDNEVTGRPAGEPEQVLLLEALAGWRRDFAIAWAAELKIGVLDISDFHGTNAVDPAANATVTYRRTAWFATLTAAQEASPNVFIGIATLNDEATLRLALPLGRSDRYFVVGYGGYAYARLVDDSGKHRAYDLRSAGASFTARSEHHPIWASLDYTFSSQLGNMNEGGVIPDIERQVVMLTIGGAFVRGADAPPVFHGVLPQILPLEEKAAVDADKASGNVDDVAR